MSTSTGAMGQAVGDAVRILWFGRYVDHVITAVEDESFTCTVLDYERTVSFIPRTDRRVTVTGEMEGAATPFQGDVSWDPIHSRWEIDCRLFPSEYVR